jgi:maleamate amidohydrolase
MADARLADYRSAGFSGRIGFGRRPALIVIDMMMSYFDRSSPMYAGVEAVLESCLCVIAAATARGVPTIYTRQIFDEPDGRSIYARKVPALKLLRRGSPLAELHPRLPAAADSVMVKHYPGAFHRTDLAARLAARGCDSVVLAGLTTSGCVRATAMDALLLDIPAAVVREAVGDRDARAHEANLFDIDGKLADVCGEAEAIEAFAQAAR